MVSWWWDLDWGTVPAWIGGSFLLAILGIRLDRRRSKRAQVDKVAIWDDGKTLHIHNRSDLPTRLICIRIVLAHRWMFCYIPIGLVVLPAIGPGSTESQELPGGLYGRIFDLVIIDDSGAQWWRKEGRRLKRLGPFRALRFRRELSSPAWRRHLP